MNEVKYTSAFDVRNSVFEIHISPQPIKTHKPHKPHKPHKLYKPISY